MATRKTVVPGAASDFDAPPEAPAELQPDPRAIAAGIPDFTKQSVAAAIRWFADNPTAPRRNVLTAEGWYVHPEAVGSRNPAAFQG